MCTYSMIADHYRDYTLPQKPYWPQVQPAIMPTAPGQPPLIIHDITRAEFDDLKRTVEEMRELLKKALEYDKRTGQPDCETEEKIAVLRQVAKIVGVELPGA